MKRGSVCTITILLMVPACFEDPGSSESSSESTASTTSTGTSSTTSQTTGVDSTSSSPDSSESGSVDTTGSVEGPRVEWLSTGGNSTCARLDDATTWCWGSNSFGKLALGAVDDSPHPLPERVEALDSMEQIWLGPNHSCGLSAGAVWCWGFNGRDNNSRGGGQLGIGEFDDCNHPDCPGHPNPELVVDVADIADVSVAFWHTCAVTTGESLYCWGANSAGELGIAAADESPHSTPELSVVMDVATVATSNFRTGVRKIGGTVDTWGYNVYGDGGVVNDPVVGLSGVVELVGYFDHWCARRQDGAALCWGRNREGQLGTNSSDDDPHPTPIEVSLTGPADQVTVGGHQSCARIGEEVFCWGQNTWGQLGSAVPAGEIAGPTLVIDLPAASSLHSGNMHECIVTGNGEAWCWGANNYGQLGAGEVDDSVPTPRRVAFPSE